MKGGRKTVKTLGYLGTPPKQALNTQIWFSENNTHTSILTPDDEVLETEGSIERFSFEPCVCVKALQAYSGPPDCRRVAAQSRTLHDTDTFTKS